MAKEPEAYGILVKQLKQYGLERLAPLISDMLKKGASAAEIELALQDTKEWKERFAGNEILKHNGMAVYSPAEYIAIEKSYAQIMKNYGLPAGFYDDPADFAKFIGNSIAPAEMEQRVQGWSDLVNRQWDTAIRDQMAAMGMSTGDMLAWAMDAKRAAPLVQRKYQEIVLGGAARRAGAVAGGTYLAKLAGMGVTEQQAQQGYGIIAESLDDAQRLGDIYGEEYDQSDMEAELFEGSGEAALKRKRLASRERAAFGGRSGVGQNTLQQSSAGSY